MQVHVGVAGKKKPNLFKIGFFVAGARHALYGKNPIQSLPLEIRRKKSTSTVLLAQTMPMLIRTVEPTDQEFGSFISQFLHHKLTDVSTLQVALITEITLD
jgi:hypothetical protein